MSTPISKIENRALALVALAALSACHHADEATGDPILCRPPGAAAMMKGCRVEHAKSPDGIVLTVRHPDGSFRRLLQVKDGRGVIAADGAETAKVSAADSKNIDVEIDGALYRLPARVTP
jgi:hypothetical protein